MHNIFLGDLMRYKKTLIMFLIALILLNLSIVLATNKNNNNINKFFRVHIVANSDSTDDQLLKYKIAKTLENYIYSLTESSYTKEESKKIIEANMKNIINICNNIISKEGYDYEIAAYIGKLKYGEKEKNNIYMEAGIYDSLKIIIGNGNGNNWWSLIYPSSIEYVPLEETSEEVEYRIYIIDWFKELLHI